MMTEWEQVEHLMAKGYRPKESPDGWVTMPGPHRISEFHPNRWAEIMKMVNTPPANRPAPMPPSLTPEEEREARNAALVARPLTPAPPPRPAPQKLPSPARSAPVRKADAEPLPLF